MAQKWRFSLPTASSGGAIGWCAYCNKQSKAGPLFSAALGTFVPSLSWQVIVCNAEYENGRRERERERERERGVVFLSVRARTWNLSQECIRPYYI
jgi:hypothetical protein